MVEKHDVELKLQYFAIVCEGDDAHSQVVDIAASEDAAKEKVEHLKLVASVRESGAMQYLYRPVAVSLPKFQEGQCPYCGQNMQRGYLCADRGAVKYISADNHASAGNLLLGLGREDIGDQGAFDPVSSFRCDKCRKLIVDLPAGAGGVEQE